MTESEIKKRAGELFRDYVQKLNRQFRDHTVYMKIISECAEIALRLSELGFDIQTNKRGRREMEELPNGEKIAVLKSSAQMFLTPKCSTVKEALEQAIVNTKIYGDDVPPEGITLILEEEIGLNAEFNPSDLVWLRNHGLGGGEKKTVPEMTWRFTEEQRHALLIALQRHWNQLKINARAIEKVISPRETWRRIFEYATEVRPDSGGGDRYILCFLIECELKHLKVIREILIKHGGRILNTLCPDIQGPCTARQFLEHMEPAHLRALEKWLDNNLATKQ